MDHHDKTPSSKYHLSPIELPDGPSSSHCLGSGVSPGLLRGLAGNLPKPSPKTPSSPSLYYNLSAQEAAYSMSTYDRDSNPSSAVGQRQYFSDLPQRKLPAYLPPHRRGDGGGVQLFPQATAGPLTHPTPLASNNSVDITALERCDHSHHAILGAQRSLHQGFDELQQTQVALSQTLSMMAQRVAVDQHTMNSHFHDMNAISESINKINLSIHAVGQNIHAIEQTINNAEQNVNAIKVAQQSKRDLHVADHRKHINDEAKRISGHDKRVDGHSDLIAENVIRHDDVAMRLARLENLLVSQNPPSRGPADTNVQPSMQLPSKIPPPGLRQRSQPSSTPIPAMQAATVVHNTYNINGANSNFIGSAVVGSSGSLASPNPGDDVFGPDNQVMGSTRNKYGTLRRTRDDPIQYNNSLRAYMGVPLDAPIPAIRASPDAYGAPCKAQGRQPHLPVAFHSPNSLDEVEVKKSVGEIFNSIATKVEQFVHRFLLSKDLQPSSKWKDRAGDRLFQECRDHVGHVGQTKNLLMSLDSTTLLFTGVLMRMLHKYVLDGSMLDGFTMTKTSQDFATAWQKEKDAAGPVTAMDHAFRDDLAKHRAKLANEIVYRTPGFHKWLQIKSVERADEFMNVLKCIILSQNHDVAVKEMKHIMLETYRMAARVRCERNFFTYDWANATFAFNYQTMVHRNAEFIGQTLDELPSKYVVLCTVAPLFVEKIFANKKMEKIVHHKIQVYLGPRHGNLR